MKPYISKSSFSKLAALMLMLTFTVSCSKNENETNQDTPKRVELARINGFQDITLPEKANWQVIENPEWAVPTPQTGDANTALQLFVETNDEEADRTGKLTVELANGKTCTYELYQIGTLRDKDNASITDAQDIKLTYGVGYSLNILEDVSAKASKYAVKSTSPFNFAKLLNTLKSLDEGDAFFSEDRFMSRTENITGKSTEDIASQLAVNGKIEAGMDAFKLTVKGSYSTTSTSSDEYVYAMQKIQHIVSSRYMRSGLLKRLAENGSDVYQTKFNKLINKLKENPNDKTALADIIRSYGTHIITYGALGGELSVAMQMKKTDTTNESDIFGALDLSTKVINASGEVKMSSKEKTIVNNTTVSLTTYGGGNVYSIAPGATFESFMSQLKNGKKMTEWQKDIENGYSLALIDVETIPIYDLMPTAEARDALRNYILTDYQRSLFGSNFKPGLYKITGYDVTEEEYGSGSVTLDEIGQMVEVKRDIVSELSEDEYSTIIYSGAIGKLNYRCGFFVGSSTRKPAKVRMNDEGDVTSIEEFKALPARAVTEVYIDASGDVTLVPKGASSLYQIVTIEWGDD